MEIPVREVPGTPLLRTYRIAVHGGYVGGPVGGWVGGWMGWGDVATA